MTDAPADIEMVVAADVAVDPSRRYATLTFMRGAVVALSIAVLAGLFGALYYIPAVAGTMRSLGLQFTSLRPLHTTFAAVFVFLGGVAVIHRFFEDVGGPMSDGERLRLRAQVILWAVAGIGVLVSLIAGVFSGREYVGFHPVFSIPILLGWLLFAWNFFLHVGRGFLRQPVHVTMWTVGVLYFIYTFLEQHSWLLPGVFADPLIDTRLQWKATGTLVGSFNLIVYGSLTYLACKLGGNDRYAHSHLAYGLFGVGLLNSFTNFGHHTYHLPQNDAVKWIAFVISMLEIILLARVVWDIAGMFRARRLGGSPEAPTATQSFLTAAKWWTAYILASSLVLSVPPLNALVHGTTVIMAHGMGAEIGIDGMVLFAAISWMLCERLRRRNGDVPGADSFFTSPRLRRSIIGLNIGAASLVGWLTLAGTITGVHRYRDLATPEWVSLSHPYVLVSAGAVTAWFLASLLVAWGGHLVPAGAPRIAEERTDLPVGRGRA